MRENPKWHSKPEKSYFRQMADFQRISKVENSKKSWEALKIQTGQFENS
jgi:hypothetical protein